jgi:BON domain-containing protein
MIKLSLCFLILLVASCSNNRQVPSGGITTSSGAGTGGTVNTGTTAPTGGTTTTSPTGTTGTGTRTPPGQVIPSDESDGRAAATTAMDQNVAAAVRKSLQDAGMLSQYQIQVSVHNGVVTLQGAVPDRSTEDSIVDLVRKVEGVKDVYFNR